MLLCQIYMTDFVTWVTGGKQSVGLSLSSALLFSMQLDSLTHDVTANPTFQSGIQLYQ
jgi:hypothetical protein